MTVKKKKKKINRLSSNVDDLPVYVFNDVIKNGSNYSEIKKVFKVGKIKEDIKCVGVVIEDNGEILEL